MRDRLESNSLEQDIVLEVHEEKEKPKISAWAQVGKKKQKLIEITNKVMEKDLQIMQRRRQYFDYLRNRYFMRQSTENYKIPNKIELEAKMIDVLAYIFTWF